MQSLCEFQLFFEKEVFDGQEELDAIGETVEAVCCSLYVTAITAVGVSAQLHTFRTGNAISLDAVYFLPTTLQELQLTSSYMNCFDSEFRGHVNLKTFRRLCNLQTLCLQFDDSGSLSWSTDCALPKLTHLEVRYAHLYLEEVNKFSEFVPSIKKMVVTVGSEHCNIEELNTPTLTSTLLQHVQHLRLSLAASGFAQHAGGVMIAIEPEHLELTVQESSMLCCLDISTNSNVKVNVALEKPVEVHKDACVSIDLLQT